MSIEEKARLDGTLALTPICVTPDELMIIARTMHEEARNRAQARQKIYHRLTSSVMLVYDPEITLMSTTAQTTRGLPGSAVSDMLEKSIREAVQNEDQL
jgi:hypothetical protein